MILEIRVPATTANLGAGFDCLGLALELFNETTFEIEGKGMSIEIEGEGAGVLKTNKNNLIMKTFNQTYKHLGEEPPKNYKIYCKNNIPLNSGLGSSAAAVLTGIVAANQLLGNRLNDDQIIELGAEIEGHPDNIAAAYFGGLVLSAQTPLEMVFRQIEIPRWLVAVVLPEVEMSTEANRKALPKKVSLNDAAYNIGQALLTVEALKQGSLKQLQLTMQDKLHQPYRLPLIPGAAEAIKAAEGLGAAAALSGSGPSVAAFGLKDMEEIGDAMQKAFKKKKVESQVFILGVERRKVTVAKSSERRS